MKRLTTSAIILLLVLLSFPEPAFTTENSPPPLIGKMRRVKIAPAMTLMELAVREGVGFQALQNANPGSDPWRPDPGQSILIPAQAIFPGPPVAGLTINLAELRVYFIADQDGSAVRFHPLGIGRQGWETPEGDFQVVQKVENPVWRVPPAIKQENPELPDFIPAGPQNPLGKYWLGLSIPGYGLHGTNRPYGVGRRVSHGCIRLYDEDIKALFAKVQPGTRVRILYQPVKATIAGGDLYLEVHPDFDQRHPDLFQEALFRISALSWPGDIDYGRVRTLVSEQRGIPARIGSLQTQTGPWRIFVRQGPELFIHFSPGLRAGTRSPKDDEAYFLRPISKALAALAALLSAEAAAASASSEDLAASLAARSARSAAAAARSADLAALLADVSASIAEAAAESAACSAASSLA